MRLVKATLMAMLLAALGACSGAQNKTARDGGGHTGNNAPTESKPVTGKVIEKIQNLQFQKPTHDESQYLNVMNIDFTGGDRAYYTFLYAPGDDGTFYFTLDQARLLLQDCTKDVSRSYTMEVYWQRAQGGQRVLVKRFNPSIDDFQFQRGNTYYLTYALMDLKQFSDCKSATLKFATFMKNY